MVKLWIKILACDKDQLIWIAYDSMLKSKVYLSNSNVGPVESKNYYFELDLVIYEKIKWYLMLENI